MSSPDELLSGVVSGIIKKDPDVSLALQPQLVLNDPAKGQKTLEFVIDQISLSTSFTMAVAFVTRSGVACIHQALKEFGERGGRACFLVSTYLNFSDPEAIRALTRFRGVEVRLLNEPNFHGKTYLFERSRHAQLMIGSSNLTQNALGKNTEVNLTMSLGYESALYRETREQLDFWLARSRLADDSVLSAYRSDWLRNRQQRVLTQSAIDESTELLPPDDIARQKGRGKTIITPNKMQQAALQKLDEIRSNGTPRSLLISATGTGKTVLAALDVRQSQAKKMLFVVHRLTIAKKALDEFRKVFGPEKSMGIYSAGASLDRAADFLFCTVQTITNDRHLNQFATDEFDYLIVDETHRAGATTYKKVLEYFQPNFLLGMTATPERTDGFDIFSLFNHSVAYEIRLKDALESDLLSPFHYFGVSELTVAGTLIDDKAQFGELVSSARVDHILAALGEYGADKPRTRGLIFCSRVDEARELSREFNLRGFRSLPVTGSDSEQFREEAIRSLETDGEDSVEYLFTVDIFNEGVDIPSVNKIVMLRPTQSSIVFVQQLGRGLRKAPGKEYLTVIDFIGNYQNNYMIPLALFGDSTYNKDKLRRLLSAGSSLVPGASSISFDEIAKEQIFKSIDVAKLNTKKALTEDYNLLKFRLGRSPMMCDFQNNNARDPYQYVEYKGSLAAFVQQIDPDVSFSDQELRLLAYLGKHVVDGIRLEEGAILEAVLDRLSPTLLEIQSDIYHRIEIATSKEVLESAIHNINLHFITERFNNQNLRVSEVTGFNVVEYEESTGRVMAAESLQNLGDVARKYLMDLVKASNQKFMTGFDSQNYVGGFKRGEKYTRKDVFRILRWDKLPNAQNVGGYIVSSDGSNCPIFLTYHKEEGISETTKYEDRFISPGHVEYMSKNRRTLSSPDVKAIREHESNGTRLPFFVKKSDDEGLSFYYLGDLYAKTDSFVDTRMSGEEGVEVPVVKMEFNLDKEVESRLFKYLTQDN